MTVQQRYDDIVKRSGLSEEILRRAFKATRESLADSLRKGERATLHGICTIVPEKRHRLSLGGEDMTSYIKLKADVSSALNSELNKEATFLDKEVDEKVHEEEIKSKLFFSDSNVIKATQISALL